MVAIGKIHNKANGGPRAIAALLLATMSINLAAGQALQNMTSAITAKIVLGSHDGSALPGIRGHGYTGGGNIDISQPTPDALVITMTGAVAACANVFATAEAALEFCQGVHFAVEFSQPGCTGKLIMQAKVNGLLRAHGKQSIVGMVDATSSLACGPSQLAVLPLPARMEADGASRALTASCGPVNVPIQSGQFSLWQHFRIAASQGHGLACCKASAEFSPSALSDAWIATRDPFHGVDKQNLGYQVILRVVPDPVASEPSHSSAQFDFTPRLSTLNPPRPTQGQ